MTGEVITSTNNKLFITLRNHSAEADLVFLGIRAPKDGETDDEYSLYYEELLDKTKDFPMIIKTLAAENIEFQRIFKS
jgi:hypothetical protein